MCNMQNKIVVFIIWCMSASTVCAESFLSAQQFPKTFEDLSFKSRIEVLRDGYKPFEIEYDDNGVCVRGCAYRGLNIKDDMIAVDEATNEMADLIANAENEAIQQSPVYNEYIEDDDPPETTDNPPQDNQNTTQNPPASNWCMNGRSTKLPLRYPVDMTDFRHPVTSDFGFRQVKKGSKFHPALDIGVPVGTPVYATADGVVDRVGYDKYGGGKIIDIKHENGLITQYMHLSKQLVKIGQTVRACDKIALSGNTGTSSGPHLDYRVRFDSDKNKYVDILCPSKASNRKSRQSYDIYVQDIDIQHSLFYAPYRFQNRNDKHSKWRIEHGHCMFTFDDLLPDEAR